MISLIGKILVSFKRKCWFRYFDKLYIHDFFQFSQIFIFIWLWQHNWIHFRLLIHDLRRFLHWILEYVVPTENNFDLVLSTCRWWMIIQILTKVCIVEWKFNSRFFWHYAICKKNCMTIFQCLSKSSLFIQIDILLLLSILIEGAIFVCCSYVNQFSFARWNWTLSWNILINAC